MCVRLASPGIWCGGDVVLPSSSLVAVLFFQIAYIVFTTFVPLMYLREQAINSFMSQKLGTRISPHKKKTKNRNIALF